MGASGADNSEIKRLLIVRRSSLGDIVHTMPMLVALRRGLPEAHIAWLVDKRFAEVLTGHPALDEVITIRRHGWRHPLAAAGELRQVTRYLQQSNFDVAVDPQALLKSTLLCYLSGAARRIGFSYERREFSQLFINEHIPGTPDTHAVPRALLIAEYLGCPTEPVEFQFPRRESREAWADNFLTNKQVNVDQPLIGLNIGASAAEKMWPVGHFAQLADMLQSDTQAQLILLGSASEMSRTATIQQLTQAHMISAVGQTSIAQLAALLRRCTAIVSADTGPLHIAVAVGTPVVGLYGASDPRKTGPWGEGHVVVSANLPCSPCQRQPTCKDFPCMQQISPQMVAEAVMSLLQQRNSSQYEAAKGNQ